MIEGLRDASSELVKGELVRLEPLLRRIYATTDPHPEFRILKLLSRMYRGSGRVLAEVEDPRNHYRSEAPGAYLSSSQMNVACSFSISRVESWHSDPAAKGGHP